MPLKTDCTAKGRSKLMRKIKREGLHGEPATHKQAVAVMLSVERKSGCAVKPRKGRAVGKKVRPLTPAEQRAREALRKRDPEAALRQDAAQQGISVKALKEQIALMKKVRDRAIKEQSGRAGGGARERYVVWSDYADAVVGEAATLEEAKITAREVAHAHGWQVPTHFKREETVSGHVMHISEDDNFTLHRSDEEHAGKPGRAQTPADELNETERKALRTFANYARLHPGSVYERDGYGFRGPTLGTLAKRGLLRKTTVLGKSTYSLTNAGKALAIELGAFPW
jgi:hypothetical protein